MTTGATAEPRGALDGANRVLLVFSDDGDPAFAEQAALLDAADPGALEERDLVVLLVPRDGTTRVIVGGPAEAYDAAALRRKRGVAANAGFTALLVGKDGGTKWRADQPARPVEIFALIDSMPMRANEMKRNGPKG